MIGKAGIRGKVDAQAVVINSGPITRIKIVYVTHLWQVHFMAVLMPFLHLVVSPRQFLTFFRTQYSSAFYTHKNETFVTVEFTRLIICLHFRVLRAYFS